jgi:K+-transporting ATPase ATPase C chain
MKHFRTSVLVLLASTVVLGGVYPLLMTGIGALFFPAKASGSLVRSDGTVKGSELIGQDFTGPRYFHPRPSAAGYDASSSGAGNQGYTSRELKDAYDRRKADWEKANGTTEVPAEMMYASGSGLDPDIGPEAAELQVPRIAAARGLADAQEAALMALVKKMIAGPQLGFLGEPRVNVLELNMALDGEFPMR